MTYTKTVLPQISICLPSLNTVKYIGERIQSIRKQTYLDFEVLVADSFSTDGTWEALVQWASEDCRVDLKQVPRGLYQAWNNCISRARGKWIYFATSDDTMRADALEKMLLLGESATSDIVSSQEWRIDSDGVDIAHYDSLIYKVLRFNGINLESRNRSSIRGIVYGIIVGTPAVSITQLLIRRSVFSSIGSFSTEYQSFGDFEWQIRALCKTRWSYLPEKLGAWRIHSDQVTNVSSSKHGDARCKILSDLYSSGLYPKSIAIQIALGYMFGISNLPPYKWRSSTERYLFIVTRNIPKAFIYKWRLIVAIICSVSASFHK
jgi:glycosyltransferase involved in cell wall biosynthesis